jgi:hypothetical protein
MPTGRRCGVGTKTADVLYAQLWTTAGRMSLLLEEEQHRLIVICR